MSLIVLKHQLEANTMDVSLWLSLYKIYKDNNPLGKDVLLLLYYI